MYHYKKGQFEKAYKGATSSLEIEPDVRQYVLRAIANCYREKDCVNAENYYLKSIEDFPDFYLSKKAVFCTAP